MRRSFLLPRSRPSQKCQCLVRTILLNSAPVSMLSVTIKKHRSWCISVSFPWQEGGGIRPFLLRQRARKKGERKTCSGSALGRHRLKEMHMDAFLRKKSSLTKRFRTAFHRNVRAIFPGTSRIVIPFKVLPYKCCGFSTVQ